MRSVSLWALLFFLAVVQLVAAQGSNVITVPPGGFNVTAGEIVTIEWTDPSLSTVTIQLVLSSGSGNAVNLGSTLPNNGTATLSIPADISTTQQYQFKIIDDSNSSNSKISPSFTISPPTSGTVTTTSVSSSSPSSSATSRPPSLKSGLSSGAIAGIAAGVVLSACILLGALFFFLWRRRKHRRWSELQEQERRQHQHQPEEVHYQSQTSELYDDRVLPYDIHAQCGPHPQSKSAEPCEVAGNKTFPREMEGMSRFQHIGIAELSADREESGPEKR